MAIGSGHAPAGRTFPPLAPDLVRMRVAGLRPGKDGLLRQALQELSGVVHAVVDIRRGLVCVYQHQPDLGRLRRTIRRNGGVPGRATVYLG